jgi:DNA-binding transcriptional regulator YdaS (Cro superfamily)
MSSTTIRLLESAAEIAGGKAELAARLGVTETMLSGFMSGFLRMPDALLLQAVDVILGERQLKMASPHEAPAQQRRD